MPYTLGVAVTKSTKIRVVVMENCGVVPGAILYIEYMKSWE